MYERTHAALCAAASFAIPMASATLALLFRALRWELGVCASRLLQVNPSPVQRVGQWSSEHVFVSPLVADMLHAVNTVLVSSRRLWHVANAHRLQACCCGLFSHLWGRRVTDWVFPGLNPLKQLL